MSKQRETKYHTHVLPRFGDIENWVLDGLSDRQIANNLGVAYSTFRKYRDENEALSALLKESKSVVDLEVENKLFKLCMGYEDKEEKDEFIEVNGVITRKKTVYKKKIQPNVTAIIFWLKNRMPEQYRNYTELAKRQIEADIKLKELEAEMMVVDEEQDSKIEEMINKLDKVLMDDSDINE